MTAIAMGEVMAVGVTRRAELMMVLAYATDLATGQSRDFALKGCVLAMRLAEAAGWDESQRRNVYHQALLRYIGCNADSHLLTSAFGDEIAMRQDLAKADLGNNAEVVEIFMRALNRAFAGLPQAELAEAVGKGMAEAMQVSVPILAGHCEVAQRIGQRIGLSGEMLDNLGKLYERHDGHGLPHGLKGESISLAVQVVALAQDAISLKEAHGAAAMAEKIALRRDGAYRADLVDLFLRNCDRMLAGLDKVADRDAILNLEPLPHGVLEEAACEEAFLAIADMIDMRMPFTFGHSRAVADLAVAAGSKMGLNAAELLFLRQAACLHDIGELAVPVAVWLKPGPLTVHEADMARLHPYHSERALAALGVKGREAAVLVSRHHERLDGSGYHRSLRGPDLSPSARILAAAEAWQSAREARPHRAAASAAAVAAQLRGQVREGRLCPDATEAVLDCAGHAGHRDSGTRLSGLTGREIEVLRLIAGGLTAKEAARKLAISPKTADNHIQNLYAKIGVSTRAGAALYALEHGLLQREIVAG